MITLRNKIKKASGKVVDSTTESLNSISSITSGAVEAIEKGTKDKATKVFDEVNRTSTAIVNSTIDTADSVKDAATRSLASIDNKIQMTVDSGDMMFSHLTTRLGDVALSTGASAVVIGAGKLFIAPIMPGVFPIFVAISVLDLIMVYGAVHSESSNELKRERQKLQIKRISKCLSRYGIVTEDALFKTDKVEVKIDGESGTIDGKILVGEFKGSLLSEIDIDDLKYLSSHYDTDADTSKFLELYINYSKENQ